jgi:hypothetical protein
VTAHNPSTSRGARIAPASAASGSIDELPMQRPIADVDPPWASRCRAGRKFVLVFTFEDEVRERVLEEIRPGVFAQWSAPLERLGLDEGPTASRQTAPAGPGPIAAAIRSRSSVDSDHRR